VPEPRRLKLIAALGAARDLHQHIRLAQQAERACCDAVLVDDRDLEPTAVLAAIATATERIGLIAGTATTYNEPYNIARRFLSADHLSEGRVGWLLQPHGREGELRSYGFAIEADPVARAAEFYDVVAGLWDSWEDDALLRDKASGDYMNRDKVHFLDHVGRHFRVRGPLNITRSVQGWPVVV
jgi:alkanesulfonate monooxygenase SsuD/methylene tetrahydromethanopterin reductase-like flavin-dependent oxidoreductase (luciferase family)